MNLTNVISKQIIPKISGIKTNAINELSINSPLNGLLKPLLLYKNKLSPNISGYDAINQGALSCDTLIGKCAEFANLEKGNTFDEYVEISQDEAQYIYAGFSQAKDFIGEGQQHEKVILSTTNLVYAVQVNDINDNVPLSYKVVGNDIPLLMKNGDKYLLNFYAYAINYVNNDQLLSSDICVHNLSIICNAYGVSTTSITIYGMLQDLQNGNVFHSESTDIYGLVHDLLVATTSESDSSNISVNLQRIVDNLDPGTSKNNIRKEQFISVINNLITSTELNVLMIDTIDGITQSGIKEFITSIPTYIVDKRKAVVNVAKQISASYNQGGLKGVIYFLYRIIKHNNSMADDHGSLTYTDNEALLPREYLSGVVTGIVTAISTIISVVTAMLSPVVAAIAAVIGFIFSMASRSLNQDYSDTYSSITVPIDEESAADIINSGPMSLIRGEVNVDMAEWYVDYYNNGQTCIAIDVVGGKIMVGPGQFSQSGNILTIRWEFHPYSVPAKNSVIHDFLDTFIVTDNLGYKFLDANALSSVDFINYWNALTSSQDQFYLDIQNEDTNGHLNAINDGRLCNSTAFYCILFILYLTLTDAWMQNIIVSFQNRITADSRLVNSSSILYDLVLCIHNLINSTDQSNAYWSTLISMCSYINTNVYEYILPTYRLVNNVWIGAINIRQTNLYDVNQILHYKYFFGAPYELPKSFEYAFSAPRYNASTFWFYLSLGIIATVVTTTAVVISTFKVSRWIKKKRSENVVKFQSSQSDYQMALQGRREVIDPVTGEITVQNFDVTSNEGREYIKNCYKDLKTTTLKNNIWASLIGGTRYDYTTFYGEAENPDDEQVSEGIRYNLVEAYYGSEPRLANAQVAAVDGDASNFRVLYKLISGGDYLS